MVIHQLNLIVGL